MTYFFDANFSPKFVAAFKELGEDVVHLRSHFAPDTRDEDWIPIIGARGWTLVSMDIRIKRNPQQRAVLEAAGIVSFMCAGGVSSLQGWPQFEWLVRSWTAIRSHRAPAGRSVTFRVTMNYKVEPW